MDVAVTYMIYGVKFALALKDKHLVGEICRYIFLCDWDLAPL